MNTQQLLNIAGTLSTVLLICPGHLKVKWNVMETIVQRLRFLIRLVLIVRALAVNFFSDEVVHVQLHFLTNALLLR